MPRFASRPRRVLVIPCDQHKGYFRWIVSTRDGQQECSAYTYATAIGAQLVGEVRAREIDGKI